MIAPTTHSLPIEELIFEIFVAWLPKILAIISMNRTRLRRCKCRVQESSGIELSSPLDSNFIILQLKMILSLYMFCHRCREMLAAYTSDK